MTTVISELARNILLYAGFGEILLLQLELRNKTGLVVRALDRGPGIGDIERAVAGGFSTSGGLGMGLSGLKSIADDFIIDTQLGGGTRVRVLLYAE